MSTPSVYLSFFFFFFNDTATTEIYTLSLHDALPISARWQQTIQTIALTRNRPKQLSFPWPRRSAGKLNCFGLLRDRKSTRLNSSHTVISYAVFCLKKKKKAQVGRRRLTQDTNIRHGR